MFAKRGQPLNQTLFVESLVFVVLVAAGAGVRLLLLDYPNFAPVAGVALFAGYYFSRWQTAACVPLAVMVISDLVIGGYHPLMMVCVYGMLTLPVAYRRYLRRWLPMGDTSLSANLRASAGLVTCSLLSSVLFFVVTNFGAWVLFDMYDKSLAGLLHCYWQAIPFFRYTLLGDLYFSSVLFMAYALAVYTHATWVPAPLLMAKRRVEGQEVR